MTIEHTETRAHIDTRDVVVASVAAYNDHLTRYTQDNSTAVLDAANRFINSCKPGAMVLDAGCGPGRDLQRFADAGLYPIGVDLNESFLEHAMQFAFVRVADLRGLPFDDDVFEGTWACASLVHLPAADTEMALRELARVTVPGKPVYFSVKCAGPAGWVDTRHGRRWFTVWNPDEIVNLAAECGLVVNDVVIGDVFVDVWATAALED